MNEAPAQTPESTPKPPLPNEAERQKLMAEALVAADLEAVEIAGIKLRPFNVKTMELADALGLTMMDNSEGLTNAQLIDQISTFAWMQSAPIPEVLGSVKEGTWRDKVEVFKFELELPVLRKLLDDIGRIMIQAAACAFDLQKKMTPTTETTTSRPPVSSDPAVSST